MKNAIILHGKPGEKEYYDPKFPSPSNFHWLPWLQNQLLVKDIKADTPEVPYAFDPHWDLWLKEVERFDINAETILVGHSCGGGFWVRYLSEHPELKVGKVILVAPSLNPEQTWGKQFFDFEIDSSLAEHIKELVIFNSTDDGEGIQESVRIIREALPNTTYREFKNMGHFSRISVCPQQNFQNCWRSVYYEHEFRCN